MATYKEIENWVKKEYGFSVKTCWIAHAKEICNLNPRKAPNRQNSNLRTNPCPTDKLEAIKNAFKFYKMI
jgi:hypothetical protein